MQASDVPHALATAISIASELGLMAADASILNESNRIVLRLLPCDTVARVASIAHQVDAAFEVELAHRFAATESPVAALDPRVAPQAYVRDGFVVTLWRYYEPVLPLEVAADDYAHALARLHAGMQQIDMATPHYTDRVAQAQWLLESRDHTPELPDADRELLSNTLRRLRHTIGARRAAEQLLHGEPHPGNVLRTSQGLLFTDLETCCRGPVEFDLAHAPDDVSTYYPGADHELIRLCRILMLAMVTTWRWERDDRLPNGRRQATEFLGRIRAALARYPLSSAQ